MLAQVSNHESTHHQTDAVAASGESIPEDRECLTPKVKAAASQTVITLCSEDSDSDSSSSQRVLQSTAASARPSCRRRAALDSDSESEQVSAHRQKANTQLLPQVPSTSVYTFDVSDSEESNDADTPVAATGTHSSLEASPAHAASCQPEQAASVIVLDSSEEGNALSRRRHSYLLCSRCVLQGT